MKKLVMLAIVASMVLTAGTANATVGPITRAGIDYSGIRNPGNCEIMNDNGELHVKCTGRIGASGPAYIRYRFLKDDGGARDYADVSADIVGWIGRPATVQWMIFRPKSPARTLRITVPLGSYVHIKSVTWEQ